MSRTKRIDKKEYKLTARQCRICKEPSYELLDVHRIIPGAAGGKYNDGNVVALCVKCHRRVHQAEPTLIIDRWYYSTAGYLLRITDNGVEKFV